MALIVIGILVFCQILLYILADRYRLGWAKPVALLLLLSLHFFVLPSLVYPAHQPGIKSGMTTLGIIQTFWMIGGGVTVIIHLVFWLLSKVPNDSNYQ